EDPDVRWLAGVNESGGKTYFNQEATDELLAWMELPLLLAAAESAEPISELLRLEEVVAELSASAKASGYDLERFLESSPVEVRGGNGGGASLAESGELPEEPVTTGKRVSESEVEGSQRK